jgi:CheY-like chemotaxis protein
VVEDAGYAVLHAYDGAEARAVLERERPDLIIADINMPPLSGIALTAWVRAGKGRRSCPSSLSAPSPACRMR